MIQDRDEIGYANSALHRLHSHRQLVAEVTHGGEAHAGYAHVLAQSSRSFHVKLIQGDDAVDLFLSREVGHRLDDLDHGEVCGDIENVVETLARPVGIAESLRREQEHAAALALAFAHQFLAFFVGSDAQKGKRSRFRHGPSQIGKRLYHRAFGRRAVHRKQVWLR